MNRDLSAEAAFSPARLTAARELWRISSTELATQIGVSQGSISHYEHRGVRPSDDVLGRLARVLRVPVRYLFLDPPLARPDATQIHYRGRARIPMGERKRLEWLGAHWQELAALLARRGWLSEPKHKVPRFTGMSPAEAAQETRAFLGFEGPGPVGSMVEVLETLGVWVHVLPPGESENVDAFCFWHEGHPHVVINPAKGDLFRFRFDLAHELGHLVMHDRAEEDERPLDREADRFAAEFLVPLEAWTEECPGGSNPWAYEETKARWQVSIGCLLRRSRDAEILDDSEYRYAMMRYSKLGWRRGEPPMPDAEPRHEVPQLMAAGLAEARAEGVGFSALADELGYGDELLAEILGASARGGDAPEREPSAPVVARQEPVSRDNVVDLAAMRLARQAR